MEWEIVDAKGYDYVIAKMKAGEEVIAEPGAYMMHEGEIDIETKTFGVGMALKRAILGGEDLFLNKITAKTNTYIYFAPYTPGELKRLNIDGSMIVRDRAYLISTPGIDIDTKYIGLKGIFTPGGMYWLNLKGNGEVIIKSYGAILEIEINNQKITIDNENLLAYEPTVDVKLRKMGNLKTFIFGGEGLVLELSGHGKAYIQTRNFRDLAYRISKIITKK